MTDTDLQERPVTSVAKGLGLIAGYLSLPQADDAASRAVISIRTLLRLLDQENRAEARAPDVDAVREALAKIEPAVIADAEPLTPAYVSAGLEHVRGMLAIFGRPMSELITEQLFDQLEDHVLHAALIADELGAVVQRRAIAARASRPGRPPGERPGSKTIH